MTPCSMVKNKINKYIYIYTYKKNILFFRLLHFRYRQNVHLDKLISTNQATRCRIMEGSNLKIIRNTFIFYLVKF